MLVFPPNDRPMRRVCPILLAATVLSTSAAAQYCVTPDRGFTFSESPLLIEACAKSEPLTIGQAQHVHWTIKNLSSDTVEIRFVKEYTFYNRVTKSVSTWAILMPHEHEGAGLGAANGPLDDSFFKEDCNCPGNLRRILNITISGVEVTNISQERRDAAQRIQQMIEENDKKVKAEEERMKAAERESERENAKMRAEDRKSEEEAKEAHAKQWSEARMAPETANDRERKRIQEQAFLRHDEQQAVVGNWASTGSALLFIKIPDGEASFFRGGGLHFQIGFGIGITSVSDLMEHETWVEDYEISNGFGYQHVHNEWVDSTTSDFLLPTFSLHAVLEPFNSRNFFAGGYGKFDWGYAPSGLVNLLQSSNSSAQLMNRWQYGARMGAGTAKVKGCFAFGFEGASFLGSSLTEIGDYFDPSVSDYLLTINGVVDYEIRAVRKGIGLRLGDDKAMYSFDAEYAWYTPRGAQFEAPTRHAKKGSEGLFSFSMSFTKTNRWQLEFQYWTLRNKPYEEKSKAWMLSYVKVIDLFSKKYSNSGRQYLPE